MNMSVFVSAKTEIDANTFQHHISLGDYSVECICDRENCVRRASPKWNKNTIKTPIQFANDFSSLHVNRVSAVTALLLHYNFRYAAIECGAHLYLSHLKRSLSSTILQLIKCETGKTKRPSFAAFGEFIVRLRMKQTRFKTNQMRSHTYKFVNKCVLLTLPQSSYVVLFTKKTICLIKEQQWKQPIAIINQLVCSVSVRTENVKLA